MTEVARTQEPINHQPLGVVNMPATLADRDALVAQYAELAKTETKNRSQTQSRAGKLASIARKIGDAELDLYMGGVQFKVWGAPRAVRTSRVEMPQSVLEENIASAFKVLTDKNAPETVRASADRRINAMIHAAETREYNVTDPRVKETATAKN